MWPCPDCGEMLEQHALGCEACGSDFVNENCPVCQASISQFATSCPDCHYDLSQIGDWRLRSPYTFFGGKRKVVGDVWKLLPSRNGTSNPSWAVRLFSSTDPLRVAHPLPRQ